MEFSDLSDRPITSDTVVMSMEEIRRLLHAQVLCCEEKLDRIVDIVCGSDLISDVLAFTKPNALLLTGLTNGQIIRTAELLDLKGIIFVRDKQPDIQTIEMARESGIPLLTSPYTLYESSGILFSRGLRGCSAPLQAG